MLALVWPSFSYSLPRFAWSHVGTEGVFGKTVRSRKHPPPLFECLGKYGTSMDGVGGEDADAENDVVVDGREMPNNSNTTTLYEGLAARAAQHTPKNTQIMFTTHSGQANTLHLRECVYLICGHHT